MEQSKDVYNLGKTSWTTRDSNDCLVFSPWLGEPAKAKALVVEGGCGVGPGKSGGWLRLLVGAGRRERGQKRHLPNNCTYALRIHVELKWGPRSYVCVRTRTQYVLEI